MNILTKAAPLWVVGICLCVVGLYLFINPRKWRDSVFNRLRQRRDPLAETQKDLIKADWYLLNLRICGIAAFLFGLFSLFLGVLAFKS